jgi:multiple sugar transport system substrate-binding protein
MMHRLRRTVFGSFLILACLLAVLPAGCPKPAVEPEATEVARPLEGLSLQIAVVDDPLLATAVTQLHGEWNSQTGAELHVAQISEKDLLRSDSLPGDALLCPSHLLADLAERGQIASVPRAILRDREWGDVFELLRLREAAWGKQIMAIPFGSPVFCCYYRADLLKALGRRPPRTWSEYEELTQLLAAQKPETAGDAAWHGALEPLAPPWGALVLLARAAPAAKHRDNYSTLFNMETMEPLIAGPPFVEAMEELVAVAKLGPKDPFRNDPTMVRAAFWKGECGMVLTWPTADDEGKSRGAIKPANGGARETQPHTPFSVGFAELPGSRRVFNLGAGSWDVRDEADDSRVPLLAIAGRLGVVRATSEHREAAFQLLAWLSDARLSPQVSAASPSTTLFRQSHLQMPRQWTEPPVSALAAVQYAEVTEAALAHEQWLGALRLPGRAEYLAALNEAVAATVSGNSSALDALLQADKKWRAITDRLGRDRQRAAYRHGLGLE